MKYDYRVVEKMNDVGDIVYSVQLSKWFLPFWIELYKCSTLDYAVECLEREKRIDAFKKKVIYP